MAFQPSAYYFGICRLGFKCSWWHLRQANDAVASEPSIFSENHDYKSFPCRGEHLRTYILGSRCAWWQKTTNRHTHTHTHTHTRDNYSNPCCAHARRRLIIINAKYAGTRPWILALVRYNSVFVPLCSPNTCKDVFDPNITTFQSNCAEGLHFSAFHSCHWKVKI